MRNVYTAQTPAEAHLVAGMLEEAGIEAVVEGDLLTGARFGIGMDASTLPTVAVRDEDVTRASQILRDRRPPAGQAAQQSAADDEMPPHRGLGAFKAFLLGSVVLGLVSLAVTYLVVPQALAVLAIFVGVVGVLLLLAWRR